MKKENNLDLNPYTTVMLTETFLTHDPDEQLIRDFSFYARARKSEGRPSGGLAVLMSPLLLDTRCIFKNENILGIESQKTTFIVSYYSPKSPVAEMVVDLSSVMNRVTTKSVILCDFNCRIDSQDSRAKDLIEALFLFNLHLINSAQEMTFIDLVFVSEDLFGDADLQIIPTVARKYQQLEIIVPLTESGTKREGKRPKLKNHLTKKTQRSDASAEESYLRIVEIVQKSTSTKTSDKAFPRQKSRSFAVFARGFWLASPKDRNPRSSKNCGLLEGLTLGTEGKI